MIYIETGSHCAARLPLNSNLSFLLQPVIVGMHLSFWKNFELRLAEGAGAVFMSTTCTLCFFHSWLVAADIISQKPQLAVYDRCPRYTAGSTKALTLHGRPHKTNEQQTQVLNPATWSQSF